MSPPADRRACHDEVIMIMMIMMMMVVMVMVMMRYPDRALAYGLDNLAKCLEGLPATVTKVT